MPKESKQAEGADRKDTPPPTQKASDPQSTAAEQGKPGLKYVFKIAPADGKNSIDFEDIADK